jgi:hypothetical protein
MAQYSLAELVGKPLTAKNATKLYRTASNSAKSYASVKAGSSLGTLFSWLNPNENRSVIWFMFYDTFNKPYYVPYNKNLVDLNALKQQGIKTVDEITKDEKNKKDFEEKGAVRFYLEKYAPYLIGAIFLIPIAKKIIDKKL